MNGQQTADVFSRVRVGDNRAKATPAVIAEWFAVIGDLDFDEAIEAVTEFRQTSPDKYLMPGHLVAIAKRHRQERAEAKHHRELAASRKVGAPEPRNMAAMVVAYRAHDRAYERHLEDPRDVESRAALGRALDAVEAEEAAYNDQLISAGLPPVSKPIPLAGMPNRGGLFA